MAATVEAFARACRSLARETPDFVTSQYELRAQSHARPAGERRVRGAPLDEASSRQNHVLS
jgi:hypothetical protein